MFVLRWLNEWGGACKSGWEFELERGESGDGFWEDLGDWRIGEYGLTADLLQGDLGHTDLQEDLEFHSSSKQRTSSDPLPQLSLNLTRHPQTLKTSPPQAVAAAAAAPPKSNQTAHPHPSSPVPRPPATATAAAESTTSGPSNSTRKPLTSTPAKSCAAVPRQSTRAQTSLTC